MLRNVIIKVTLDCNIQCKYCYVQHNREYGSEGRIMNLQTVEILIKKIAEYLEKNSEIDRFAFYWHGGEPLLAGTHFFEKCYELQRQYIPENINVVNAIQTNATMLNENWIKTIKNIGYNICLSLDGPKKINDLWRMTKNGKGTHDEVVKSIELLKKYDVSPSVLAVITPDSLEYGYEIYKYFRELGITWMDFMYPFYSKVDNTLEVNIDPSLWGKFYTRVFDAWAEEDDPNIYVRMLHDMCMGYLGGKTDMCSFSSDCSYVITIDPVGEIYICDDLLSYGDSYLGNIDKDSLFYIAEHPKLKRLAESSVLYGDTCVKCDYFNMCKGGCTLFRAESHNNFSAPHFYCESQRFIIDHIKKYFQSMKISQKS